jgi:hypothetical protein
MHHSEFPGVLNEVKWPKPERKETCLSGFVLILPFRGTEQIKNATFVLL